MRFTSVPEMERDTEFGRRMRAARGWAGMSQQQLADAIRSRYTEAPASAPTIKKVERGDPSVGGSLAEWTVWVADATGVPDWFLEGGWDAPRHIRESPHMEPLARADRIASAMRRFKSKEAGWGIEAGTVLLEAEGIEVREGESTERLEGRVEERRKVEYARGRQGLIEAVRAARERALIRQGLPGAERKELLAQPPSDALRDPRLPDRDRITEANVAFILGEGDYELFYDSGLLDIRFGPALDTLDRNRVTPPSAVDAPPSDPDGEHPLAG